MTEYVEMLDVFIRRYEEGLYQICIQEIEGIFESKPELKDNSLLRSIFLNCCLKLAKEEIKKLRYLEAMEAYEKILKYEADLLFETDIVLFNVYNELSDTSKKAGIPQDEHYDKKAKNLIYSLEASRRLQKLYIDFLEGNYQKVISSVGMLEIEELDFHNRGRYYMITGSAYYYKEEYKLAIEYLLEAIDYYKGKTYNSVLLMIYEELSKCYMQTEDYELAQMYSDKSKNLLDTRNT